MLRLKEINLVECPKNSRGSWFEIEKILLRKAQHLPSKLKFVTNLRKRHHFATKKEKIKMGLPIS